MSNIEYRNPKQIQSTNDGNSKRASRVHDGESEARRTQDDMNSERFARGTSWFWILDFQHLNLFRYSIFDIRISIPTNSPEPRATLLASARKKSRLDPFGSMPYLSAHRHGHVEFIAASESNLLWLVAINKTQKCDALRVRRVCTGASPAGLVSAAPVSEWKQGGDHELRPSSSLGMTN
jgi:hypothetical protein